VPDEIQPTLLDFSWRGIWVDSHAETKHRHIRIDATPESRAETARIANSRDLDVFCDVASGLMGWTISLKINSLRHPKAGCGGRPPHKARTTRRGPITRGSSQS
jgi:hypothetical protein